jgi:ABC-type lipoprotein release transport system permease subunit
MAAAPYIEEQGMMTRGDKSSGVLLRGVMPDAERAGRRFDAASALSGRLSDL